MKIPPSANDKRAEDALPRQVEPRVRLNSRRARPAFNPDEFRLDHAPCATMSRFDVVKRYWFRRVARAL